MADPLSITASVAGIASLGFSIAKGLYRLADDMSQAGFEVRLYAHDIDAFAKLLLQVQRTIDGLTCSAKEIHEIRSSVKEILDNCNRILKPLRDVEQTLLPLLQRFKDSESKLYQVALRVRWTFVSKGKVLFYRELLQRQHQMLDTHLARATLVSVQVQMKNRPMVEMLQASLENSVSALEFVTSSPEAASAQSEVQLRLGWHTSDDPSDRPHDASEGREPGRFITATPASCPTDPDDEDSVTSQLVRLSIPAPDHGPPLVGMTEQEIRSVLSATNPVIDATTMTNMERMLNDTEEAERRTISIVSETLSQDESQKMPRTSPRRTQSSYALARCGPEVMGPWSKSTKRVFRPSQLRFEVLYEAPRFEISNSGNYKYSRIDGSEESYKSTSAVHLFALPPESQRASWLTFLSVLHILPGGSMTRSVPGFAEIARSLPFPLLKRETRSWDLQPSALDKPFATIALDELVVMAAMIGIYWTEFDTTQGKYSASNGGLTLTSYQVAGFGTVLSFRSNAPSRVLFDVLPTVELEQLAFGFFPSIFNMGDFGHRLVGTVQDIADGLVAGFGCRFATADRLQDAEARPVHMVPLVFELLGVACRTLHMKGSPFRGHPNPTPYQPAHAWAPQRQDPWKTLNDELGLLDLSTAYPDADHSYFDCLMQKIGNLAFLYATHKDNITFYAPLPTDLEDELISGIEVCDRFLVDEDNHSLVLLTIGAHFDTLLSLDLLSECQIDGFRPSRNLFFHVSAYFKFVLPRVVEEVCKVSGLGNDVSPRVTEAWCTVIFRILCWLSLHTFHPEDAQIPGIAEAKFLKTELYID